MLLNQLIQVDSRNYFPVCTIISEDVISLVKNEIETLLGYNLFTTPREILEKCYLPTEQITWTEYTVVSFINLYLEDNFAFINSDFKHRSSHGLIVKKENEDGLEEILSQYFTEIGVDVVSEHELSKFLVDRAIVYKVIPHSFYNDSSLIYNEKLANFSINAK